jgi:hypothetical protein
MFNTHFTKRKKPIYSVKDNLIKDINTRVEKILK